MSWNKSKKWKTKMILLINLLLLFIGLENVCGESEINDPNSSKTNEEAPINYTSHSTQIQIVLLDRDYELINVTCENLDNSVNPSKKTSCDNLAPCKKYLVTAQCKNKLRNDTRTWSKVIETQYAKPTISVESLLSFHDSIHLYWNSTNPECILNYHASVKSQDLTESISLVLDNFKNEFEFKDLKSCQNYDVFLKSYDVHNETILDSKFQVDTDVLDPGPVVVTFTNLKNSSTLVEWKPPNQTDCVQYYDLQWAVLGDKDPSSNSLLWNYYNHTGSKHLEYVLDDLKGCEKYIFKIVVNGDEIHNSYNTTFNSAEKDLGPVQSLKIQSLLSTEVEIDWKVPENNNACIKGYQTELFGPDGLETIFVKETKILLKKLKPCGNYRFTVAAITHNETQGKSSNISFTTKEDKPSPVQNLMAKSYPKEIYVSWQEPNFSELCIKNYQISLSYEDDDSSSTNSITNTTEYKNITVKNLKACTVYTIQVVSITSGKINGKEGQIKSETKPMTTSPPDNIEFKSFTHNSIELRAEDTDRSNNCQILFVRFMCKTDLDVEVKNGETILDVKGSLGLYTGIVKPLSAYTKYTCRVQIFNIAGWSNYNEAVCTTGKYYPDIPSVVEVNQTTKNSIHITWKPPKYPNGNIIMYKLHIQTLRPLYRVPSNCKDIDRIKQTIEVSKTEFMVQDVLPYVEYGIQIAVMNDFGVGDFSSLLQIATKATNPTPVENLTTIEISPPALNEEEYESFIVLEWILPCHSNGRIKEFQLNFTGNPESSTAVTFTRILPVAGDPLLTEVESFNWNESEILPECYYSVEIKAVLMQGYESSLKILHFNSPAGIPRKTNISGRGIIDPFSANNPTSSALAKISKKIFFSDMGNILYAALLVSEKDCQNDTNLTFGVLNIAENWPNVSSWQNAQLYPECIKQYQTTPKLWSPFYDIYDRNYVTFVIGAQKDCVWEKEFCNGPLKPGTKYEVVLRLFTKSAYNDVAKLSFHTDSEVKLAFILLLAISCLLIAFFLGVTYLWITKKLMWHKDSIDGMENSNADITAKNFCVHYDEISKRDKLCREFKELTAATTDLDFSNYASKSNEPKNRYSNIYPYDKNRVILDSDSDGSDYINASFINGYKKKKEYIATQGPKPDSFIDFWRMILQYNVHVIAMVTEMKEGETIKCHQYFPYLSDTLRFGHNITVQCKKEEIERTYERRELVVKHLGYGVTRNVIHYSFKGWPDHDCPADPTNLIDFIRKVKSEKNPSRSSIVVHCSAGVGRTGTFIGLDIIMKRLKSENKINIFETVKELRFQRMKMVQTLQQYQFLYKCAYQLVRKNFSSSSKKDCNILKNGIEEGRLSSSSTNSIDHSNQKRRQSFTPNQLETSL